MSKKKQVREKFRREVFGRDKLTCKICNTKREEKDLDAHHITNREEIEDGGYVKDNGITVCKDECHMKVELFHISDGMKYRIGKIVKPKRLAWLTPDKIDEYLKSQGWINLENAVINGFIWTMYLNEYDYKNVYLNDIENSKESIIK